MFMRVMREELVKEIYKKSKVGVRENRARIAACCCKDLPIFIAEAEEEIEKEKQIKKRLVTGMSLDIDKKLDLEDKLKLRALPSLGGPVVRERKKMASEIWVSDGEEEINPLSPDYKEQSDRKSPATVKEIARVSDCTYIYIYIYIYYIFL